MVKIPFKYLALAALVLAGILMLLPAASGNPEEDTAGDHGQRIVIEKLGTDESGREYLVYLNHKYYFDESTVFEKGATRESIKPGVWLEITSENEGVTHHLLTVAPAVSEAWKLSGTIGSLLFEPSDGGEGDEVIGFTVNDRTILLPAGGDSASEHGEHLEVGLGITATVTPIENSTFLQAGHIEILRHHDLLHSMTMLMLQISVILMVAKVAGELFERYLKQPAVLGELIGGIVISPYALGGMISIPGIGPLFQTYNLSAIMKASPLQPNFAVSPELWAIAQIAAIILLFMAGLETDLSRFLRYAGPATVVGLGGVIAPFVLGIVATIWLVPGTSILEPTPLFMGAIMVATSVGITARVLSDINRLDTSEGVTILAGAVIDDVLGILVLAIISAVAMAELRGTQIDVALITGIALKAVLFWLGLTGIGILVSRKVEKFLNWFRSKGATFALGLSICFAAAATAELFGLAMIIGAYSIGLALSDRDIAHVLEDKLIGAYNFVVPIFFTVMGMMVDINAVIPLFWPYGVVISVLAVISKIFGCGIPALFVGFNRLGAMRVGLGMMPRGEVALIIAGVGIANGIIATDMFGVAILITLVTTLLAPPFLVPAFKAGGLGTRSKPETIVPTLQAEGPFMLIEAFSPAHQDLLAEVFLDSLVNAGYRKIYGSAPEGIYEVEKNGKPVVIRHFKDNGKQGIAIDGALGTRDDVREALFGVTELMLDYRERIVNEIVKSDPKFRRRITRVIST